MNPSERPSSQVTLSVVATLYFSEAYISEFYRRTREVLEALGVSFEILFVNDGSQDSSLECVRALRKEDPHVAILDLSRNCGHHRAIMAGLDYAQGEFIFLIDCDLEEDPAWLMTFWKQMQSQPVDLVYGVQSHRKGGPLERWSGYLFYKAMHLLANMPELSNPTTARLMSRRFVERLLDFPEKDIYFFGLCSLVGFDQLAVPVQKGAKESTTYSWKKRLSLALSAITAFSKKPLEFIFWLGFSLFVFSLALVARILIRYWCSGVPVSGWTSLFVSLWMIGGLIILMLGVIGTYLAKVFEEIKQRPRVVVRTYEGTKPST